MFVSVTGFECRCVYDVIFRGYYFTAPNVKRIAAWMSEIVVSMLSHTHTDTHARTHARARTHNVDTV